METHEDGDPDTGPFTADVPPRTVHDLARAYEERLRPSATLLAAENERLRAAVKAAAWLYMAISHHKTAIHPAPAPAPVLPLTSLYHALIEAGYTRDGQHVDPEAYD